MPDVTTSSSGVAVPNGKRRWTVMVFMGADTVDGEAPLLSEAKANIAGMHKVMADLDPADRSRPGAAQCFHRVARP